MVNSKLTEREKQILQYLTDDTSMSVNDMSSRLSVSPVTIRSDLNSLAERGFLLRTRGGAMPAFHPQLLERQKMRTAQKNRIAREAANMVSDGDTVMIEAGTTTSQIARFLFGKQNIHIVTNSTLIIPFARANPALRLTVVGGEFRPETESMVGPLALEQLERFHVSLAFVGTDGFSRVGGLTTHLVEGAEVVKLMARQAEHTVLVADSSKYNRRGFAKVLPLNAVDKIITDTDFSETDAGELESEEIQVVRV
ncbi:MAG: DeoR/GlpR family DNA-binding transcription regulator [Spirochaetales bacterium]|nr:DeoR/GlpR family DNA-binding transcription regulator [Spirochaetales bacterium]